MFLVLTAVFFAVCGGLCYWRYSSLLRKNNDTDWEGGAIVFWFCAMLFLGASLVCTGISYTSQLDDFEEIKKIERFESIYKNKADTLTKQFAGYLAEMYPKYEKDIFNTIAPDKVSLYMVKYPDLKASATIMALVENILKLQNDYYACQLSKETTMKDMRFRMKNPWIFGGLIPRYEPSAK